MTPIEQSIQNYKRRGHGGGPEQQVAESSTTDWRRRFWWLRGNKQQESAVAGGHDPSSGPTQDPPPPPHTNNTTTTITGSVGVQLNTIARHCVLSHAALQRTMGGILVDGLRAHQRWWVLQPPRVLGRWAASGCGPASRKPLLTNPPSSCTHLITPNINLSRFLPLQVRACVYFLVAGRGGGPQGGRAAC